MFQSPHKLPREKRTSVAKAVGLGGIFGTVEAVPFVSVFHRLLALSPRKT